MRYVTVLLVIVSITLWLAAAPTTAPTSQPPASTQAVVAALATAESAKQRTMYGPLPDLTQADRNMLVQHIGQRVRISGVYRVRKGGPYLVSQQGVSIDLSERDLPPLQIGERLAIVGCLRLERSRLPTTSSGPPVQMSRRTGTEYLRMDIEEVNGTSVDVIHVRARERALREAPAELWDMIRQSGQPSRDDADACTEGGKQQTSGLTKFDSPACPWQAGLRLRNSLSACAAVASLRREVAAATGREPSHPLPPPKSARNFRRT